MFSFFVFVFGQQVYSERPWVEGTLQRRLLRHRAGRGFHSRLQATADAFFLSEHCRKRYVVRMGSTASADFCLLCSMLSRLCFFIGRFWETCKFVDFVFNIQVDWVIDCSKKTLECKALLTA